MKTLKLRVWVLTVGWPYEGEQVEGVTANQKEADAWESKTVRPQAEYYTAHEYMVEVGRE